MKVVLLEDVKSLGKKGDVVEVKEGYARNFLFPQKKGVEATQGNLTTLKHQKENEAKLAAEQLAAARELAEQVEKFNLELKIKGGEGGKTFGSVSGKEIADELKKASGLDVDKKKIVLAEPIKKFGEYEVPLKLHKDVTAKLKVKVIAE